MELKLGPRRAVSIDIADRIGTGPAPLTPEELADFEHLDQVYRAACGLLYNYVPMSGHPGGSISSGRFVQMLLFDALDYDLSDPWRADADIISYAPPPTSCPRTSATSSASRTCSASVATR